MHSKLIAAREQMNRAEIEIVSALNGPLHLWMERAKAAQEYLQTALALNAEVLSTTFRPECINGLEGIPSDLIKLVSAARAVAYGDQSPEMALALDDAVEAFVGHVPWSDEPDAPEPFAKLFVVDGRQVLYLRDDDDEAEEDDLEVLHQIVDFDGMRVDAKLSGLTKAAADKAFDMMDQETARRLVDYEASLVAGMKGSGE